MKKNRSDFTSHLILLILVCLFVTYSCNKPSAVEFENSFVKPITDEQIDVKDTIIYLNVKDVQNDIQSNLKIIQSIHFASLGRFTTDVFGTIESSLFLQLKPTSFPFSLKAEEENITLDSVVLSLKYKSYEGDSVLPNSFSVYPINDDKFVVNKDKNLHYNNNILYKGTAIGTYDKSIQELRLDSASDSFTTHRDVMKIKLDTIWAKQFFRQDNTTGYKNDSAYNNFFNGLAIIPNADQSNAILNFNLGDTSTRLLLYYTYTKDEEIIKHLDEFSFTSTSAFATEVHRDKSTSLAQTALNNQINNEDIFLQPSPNGSAIIIEAPDLNFLGNKVVNRAEILLEEKTLPLNRFRTYIKPQQLYIDVLKPHDLINRYPLSVGLTSAAYTYTFFPSSRILNFSVLEGKYTDKDDYKGYKINLSRYLQAVASHKQQFINFKVWAPYIIQYNIDSEKQTSVRVSSNNILAQSGIYLYGQKQGETKSIRLHIIYTTIF